MDWGRRPAAYEAYASAGPGGGDVIGPLVIVTDIPAELSDEGLRGRERAQELEAVRRDVRDLTSGFPLYPDLAAQ